MPKKFPAPPKLHPKDDDSVTAVVDADPLADLLFSDSPHVDVADFLRRQDEPNANVVAEFLLLAVKALPAFRRAVADGAGAAGKVFELAELHHRISRSKPTDFSVDGLGEHRRMITSIEDEKRTASDLAGAWEHGTQALQGLLRVAPALLEDLRSEPPAKKAASAAEVAELRLQVCNFLIDQKLDIDTISGWPRSQHKRHGGSDNRRARLVTVAKAGMRGTA